MKQKRPRGESGTLRPRSKWEDGVHTVKCRPGSTSKISICRSDLKHKFRKQLRKHVGTEYTQASIQAVLETAEHVGLVLKQLAGCDSFKAMP